MCEPLLEEREREKFHKYQELAADLATQYHGWRVTVVPIVVGSLGTLRSLRQNLQCLAILPDWPKNYNLKCSAQPYGLSEDISAIEG